MCSSHLDQIRDELNAATVWGHDADELADVLTTSQPAPLQEPTSYNEFVETACALIKAADDAAVDGDYMLDSDDCIKVLRGTWKGPMANDMPQRPAAPVQPEFPQCAEDLSPKTLVYTAKQVERMLATTPAAPVQEPVLKPLSEKWKWVLHESFADVAGFDEEGFPSFYWEESVTKFKSGQLSVPCKGKNCGSLNGWLHSAECRAEHEAQYTTPPVAQRQWVGLTEKEILECRSANHLYFYKAIEAKLKEKNT
jgi:hypothetical protein